MRRILLFGSIVALVLVVNLVGNGRGSRTLAQESTPATACVAPDLPPATPVPVEDGTEHDHEATPEAQAETEDAGPMSLATPEGEAPADEATAAATIAGVENLIACINTGDYVGLTALMTESFIHTVLGVPSSADVPATFDGAVPLEVVSLDNVLTYEDGSSSVDIVYTGLFNGPGGISAERWFIVEDGGYLKINFLAPIAMPDGALPEAIVVDVTMVDYAFALGQSTLPANTPIIFRLANTSAGGEGHVAVLVTYPEGTTPETLISGESDVEASTAFLAEVYLDPGQTGDMAVTGLEAGTYFLVCYVATPDGTPHHDLGMVAQVTVE